jgi:hypothetical protein
MAAIIQLRERIEVVAVMIEHADAIFSVRFCFFLRSTLTRILPRLTYVQYTGSSAITNIFPNVRWFATHVGIGASVSLAIGAAATTIDRNRTSGHRGDDQQSRSHTGDRVWPACSHSIGRSTITLRRYGWLLF